jgi:hypothetical protein
MFASVVMVLGALKPTFERLEMDLVNNEFTLSLSSYLFIFTLSKLVFIFKKFLNVVNFRFV